MLHDVSFEVGENEILALIGASGSGKTTIARCVAGLQKPDAGSVRFRQSELTGTRREIQMVFQGGGLSLDPTMSAWESVAEGVWSATPELPKHELRQQAGSVLQLVGIPLAAAERVPEKLSGGERQRVALARSLAARPSLLILDEPTSALDVITATAFLDLVVKLQVQQKFSILYITHDVPLAFHVCSRVAVLHDGTIIEQGPTKDILHNPTHSFTRQLLRDCALFPSN
ncbi:MAG: ABC transporter ATP-binding protein [Bacteroidota bacterium]